MARWQPARTDVIAEYAAEVAGLFPRGRIVVGLDGIETPYPGSTPSDREAFAADLAASFTAAGVPAVAVPLGAFLPDGEPADPARLYDVARFREQVLTPYRAGRAFAVTRSDPAAGADGGWTTNLFEPGERAALVVSGAFAHLGELAGIWHRSAWLQIPRAEAYRREALRLDEAEDGPLLVGWERLVDAAFRAADARKRAAATFDLTDPEHPRRQFEDAC